MENGLEMVYVERYSDGNKWSLVDFYGNDNGERILGNGSIYCEQRLKKMEG